MSQKYEFIVMIALSNLGSYNLQAEQYCKQAYQVSRLHKHPEQDLAFVPAKKMGILTDPIIWKNVLEKAQAIYEEKKNDITFEDKQFDLLVNHLVLSKKVIASLPEKTHVTIVFAVYKEHRRMLPKTLHKHGEDCIREKIRQMNWFAECSNFSWDMIIVDDGCPNSSGVKAQQILHQYEQETGRTWPVSVVFLSDCLKTPIPNLRLKATKESIKGGSIYYGLWHAYKNSHKIAPQAKHHLVLYTDADLSAHLGQIGIALDKIINQGYKLSFGSRKLDPSFAQRPLVQTKAGKLCTYILNNLFPALQVADTQAGFKLLHKNLLKEVFKHKLEEYGWCFDVELLLLANTLYSSCIKEFGFVWIDSIPESKTRKDGDTLYYLQCYLEFYKGLERLYRKYGHPRGVLQESFFELIVKLNLKRLKEILDHCPPEIFEKSDRELLRYKGSEARKLEALGKKDLGGY